MFSWAAAIVATISQFSYQFRSRLISQLIKGISSVLQKLLRYCNGTIISTFTAWKVSKYGVISGPYLPVFGLNTEIYGPEITLYLDNFHAAIICAVVACLACSFFFILNKSVIALASVKSIIALLAPKAGSSLQYCHKIPDVFE